ncbi:FAD-dependent monooxygenase [Streptomyces sp. NPDC087897]|uniref:FAD-dependent monooxygenase n=1 Tax=Streptomyces sp. NPDC087897 TaxID=3365817 RepID=UPI003811F55F
MARSGSTDVLVVGAGPVGLTLAGELRRAGVACRIVDRLPARLPYAKAVGLQPRTLELFDRMGLVREVLDAAVPLRGQLTYVDGVERGRVELVLPPEVPYGFAALPQYETERVLEEFLGRYGTAIERSTALVAFAPDPAGVTSRLTTASGGEEEVRSRFLVGCDGAHSVVRKGLGLSFEGGAFPEEYMLADVEVDWGLPSGYGVRSMRRGADGAVDDLLVCVPLPGAGRYRMSMHAPPELSAARQAEAAGASGGGRVAHGLEGGTAPGLADVQEVLDRLAPEPVTASALRWSSVFRISHRLVDRYGEGRVFVAGDAAHIHPPTGAQGMNTGVQDAANLAWKLALAVGDAAGPRVLASYDAERRPVGEEVVARTVRHAAEGVQADPEDPETLLLREAQLLVAYRDSPLVAPPPRNEGSEPRPGDRAPDCGGLSGDVAAYPERLFDLLRGRGHVLLVYGRHPAGDTPSDLAAAAREVSRNQVATHWILPAGAPDGTRELPHHRDSRGEFARTYGAGEGAAFLVRPDGHLAACLRPPTVGALAAALERTFPSSHRAFAS